MENNKVLEFWENLYSSEKLDVSLETIKDDSDFVKSFLDRVKGKEVLDLGCGRGYLTLLLACHGARVTSIDISENACRATEQLLDKNINLLHGSKPEILCMDAMELEKLGENRYDFIFGKFILHHIEPFDRFAEKLACVTKPGGTLFFYENSANNPILMFCRTFLVGRFGIPRYGDGVEMPLSNREVEELKKRFKVKVTIPRLVFFEMMNSYLFKGRAPFLMRWDEWCYQHLPLMRGWSYHQTIEMQKQREQEMV